jgi:hypothetical protein
VTDHTSQQDALWFALGANRENGQRMTSADKRHAILMALTAWPEKSQRAIAEQIGCSDVYISQVKKTHVRSTSHLPDRVLGKDGKSYPAVQLSKVGQPRIEALLTCPIATSQSQFFQTEELKSQAPATRRAAASSGEEPE